MSARYLLNNEKRARNGFLFLMTRVYWMIYRGPGFFAVVWFGSSPPPHRQQVLSFLVLLCVVGREIEITDRRLREILVLCKLFDTLCSWRTSITGVRWIDAPISWISRKQTNNLTLSSKVSFRHIRINKNKSGAETFVTKIIRYLSFFTDTSYHNTVIGLRWVRIYQVLN